MLIRAFRPGDEPQLWRVFHSSIHTLTVDDYTREQRLAWAPDERDAVLEERCHARMQAIRLNRKAYGRCSEVASPYTYKIA